MYKRMNPRKYWLIVLLYTVFVFILQYVIPSVGEFLIQIGYLAILIGILYFTFLFINDGIKKYLRRKEGENYAEK